MDKAEASEGLNNEIYDRMGGELGNLGTDEAVKEKLLRVCRGLTMTRKIADHFSYEHILLRAAEEYAEASAALLRMRRALVIGDGSVPEAREALASELADCRVMHDQIVCKEPMLHDMEMKEYFRKAERTIKRYHVREKED